MSAEERWTRLIDADVHPLKVAVLEALEWIGEPVSPVQFEAMFGATLGTTSYHVKKLAAAGTIEVTHTRQVRGALEHFYGPVDP